MTLGRRSIHIDSEQQSKPALFWRRVKTIWDELGCFVLQLFEHLRICLLYVKMRLFVHSCGTMLLAELITFALHCGSRREVGGVQTGEEHSEKAGLEDLGRISGGMSKCNENIKELGAHPLRHLRFSAALISSPLQRQALNYHYKPESF